jgi:hypothetical protein
MSIPVSPRPEGEDSWDPGPVTAKELIAAGEIKAIIYLAVFKISRNAG